MPCGHPFHTELLEGGLHGLRDLGGVIKQENDVIELGGILSHKICNAFPLRALLSFL